MNAPGWMGFAGLLVAVVGQWLNSRQPPLSPPVVKISLVVAGLALYLPISQPWTVGFLPWFEEAWVWALAVPGMASLIALAPGMATATKK